MGMRGQQGSLRIIRIVHTCGHPGMASTNARNPNTAVDVNRQRSRPCLTCRVTANPDLYEQVTDARGATWWQLRDSPPVGYAGRRGGSRNAPSRTTAPPSN